MTDIKGIIFDYGGTIDTNGIHWAEVIREQYNNARCDIEKKLFRKAYIHGERTLAIKPIIKPSDTFRILLKKKIAIQFDYLRTEHSATLTNEQQEIVSEGCYKKVLDTLATTRHIIEELSKQYPLVLVTNFYGNMPVVLEEFRLSSYFTNIIESSIVGIRKPDPALFALGVKALNRPAENTVVIGDSYRKDIFPANSINCKTVWLKKLCWEEETIHPESNPNAIISDLKELRKIITEI